MWKHDTEMDMITRERDRLLQRSARVYGVSFAVVALLCAALPGAVDGRALLISLPLFGFVILGFVRIGASRSLVWVAMVLVAGAAIVAVLTFIGTGPSLQAGFSAVTVLAAVSVPAVALVLVSSVPRIIVLVVAFLVLGGGSIYFAVDLNPLRAAGIVVLGWIVPTALAIWINAGVPQVTKRIASIGRAHRAERQASELEAQRRQSARLLHDTVLATLTLLAHSGVGVKPEALREQAGDDARLLRQLRLGSNPTPTPPSGTPFVATSTSPIPVQNDEPVLGTTLESVKQRFGRMGLQVSWHGTGQVLLPTDVLDAFLLALAECLENVRRHSGVTEAHVTITDDETIVRALVTDSGVGFDINDIDDAKLGFAESVVARLRDVGGNARLFSAPGSGTTVVLEVPR